VTLLVDTGANKTILNARSIGGVQLPVSQPVNHGAGIIGNALHLRVDVEIAHRFLFSQPVPVSLDELRSAFTSPSKSFPNRPRLSADSRLSLRFIDDGWPNSGS
jgi:hypothetical protein